jgi:hypothetical protein
MYDFSHGDRGIIIIINELIGRRWPLGRWC